MADSYISVTNTDALVVPVKAATVYAAHESSLFLSGQLIPSVAAPNGVLQIPELAGVTASTISGDSITTDVSVTNPTDTKNIITADLFAARSVIRDLGNINPADIGRVLGNAVSTSFDRRVMSIMGSLTAQEIASGDLNLDQIFRAVGTIRAAGETGQLYGVVGAGAYAALMGAIGSTAYAGGDLFQGQALRSGFFGTIAGVQFFVSSYLTAANTGVTGAKCAIFGQDAMRIAMQKNVDVEVARRAEAVGFDVVASLHANVGLVDASRGVLIQDAA